MKTKKSIRLGTFGHVILLPFVQACGSAEPSPYDLETRSNPVVSTSEFRELGPVAQVLRETDDGRVVPVSLTEEQAIVSGDRPISPEKRDEWQAALLEFTDPSPPRPESPTEVALKYAASRPVDELVPLVLLLDEPGFDFRRFEMAKSVSDVEERDQLRSELIAEREAQLEQANQGVVRERLAELGAEVTRVLWINNSITVNVPAGAVPKVTA